jgi:hypothetical protein
MRGVTVGLHQELTIVGAFVFPVVMAGMTEASQQSV